MKPTQPEQSISFLYRAGRRERLAAPGAAPTEFLYGYPQLLAKGLDVNIIEDAEIGMAPPLGRLAALVNKTARLFGRFPIGMAVPLFQARNRARLPRHGLIMATTNGMGAAIGIGRLFGFVRARCALLAMGYISDGAGWWTRFIYRFASRHLELIAISKGEQRFLSGVFPDKTIHYLPFGVDADYWTPEPATSSDDTPFALAIGNDPNRDWGILLDAWRPDWPELRIITSLPVRSERPNVMVLRGDWRSIVLTDDAIRDLYRQSQFVIVPLRDTIQPSGQSVCLQAMACGKPVIMTRNRGFWDPELLLDDQNLLLVDPGDVGALAGAIERLIDDKELCKRLGRAARSMIETEFNTDKMATELVEILSQIE